MLYDVTDSERHQLERFATTTGDGRQIPPRLSCHREISVAIKHSFDPFVYCHTILSLNGINTNFFYDLLY